LTKDIVAISFLGHRLCLYFRLAGLLQQEAQ
jgi:hypothetical protein